MKTDPIPADYVKIRDALAAHEPLRERRAQARADFEHLESELDAERVEDDAASDERCEEFEREHFHPADEACIASWFGSVLPLLQEGQIKAVLFRGRIYVSQWIEDDNGGDPSFHVSEVLVLGEDAVGSMGLEI